MILALLIAVQIDRSGSSLTTKDILDLSVAITIPIICAIIGIGGLVFLSNRRKHAQNQRLLLALAGDRDYVRPHKHDEKGTEILRADGISYAPDKLPGLTYK
jgi:predicted esterase